MSFRPKIEVMEDDDDEPAVDHKPSDGWTRLTIQEDAGTKETSAEQPEDSHQESSSERPADPESERILAELQDISETLAYRRGVVDYSAEPDSESVEERAAQREDTVLGRTSGGAPTIDNDLEELD